MDRDYILNALNSGFSDSAIAASLGVTQSAVLQYIDAHGLRNQLEANSRFAKLDEGLNSLEEKIIKKMDKAMEFCVLTPVQLCAMLRTVNGAKRRSLAEGQPINPNNSQLVVLNLPKHMEVNVTKNSQNEVIAVDGRALNTLAANKLLKHVEQTTGVENGTQRKIEKSEIADYL